MAYLCANIDFFMTKDVTKKRGHRRWIALLVLLVTAGVLVWVCCGGQQGYHKSVGEVWTTEYHITYDGGSQLDDSIARVLEQVDASASVYNPQSTVSAINAGRSLRADEIFETLYRASVSVHGQTQGMFDPTVMPLVNAWGFGYKNGSLPSREQLDSILEFVGLEKTSLEGGQVVKTDRRIQFDFSSIAKGLACDEVGRMLSRHGVENFMVEIGGEVMCRGHNAQGNVWHVSVDLPVDEDAEAVQHQSALVLALDSGAVATSGNYRKYKMVDGRKVSHIVNPKSGESTTSSLLSVTVVASDCMSADAWATACMVLGTEAVQAMMKDRSDLGVMTISVDDQGNYVVWSNARFARMVVKA